MIEKRPKKSHISHFTILISKTIVLGLFCLMFIVACTNNDKPDKIGAVVNRTLLPKLHATEITTVISDSGITRYRISAPVWNVYDKASQPYWEFPEGIHFEKFDLNLKVESNIHSHYAKFNQNEQLWELKGKVKYTNILGELFETEQLFWNQRQERFYTDSAFKFTQVTSIIMGIGFESNQSMTHYTIKDTRGVFPLNDSGNSQTPAQTSNPTSSATPVAAPAPKTSHPPTSLPALPLFNNTTPHNINPPVRKK